MGIDSEKSARRILAVGVLFATVGILALVITLMQPGVQDQKARLADEIFDENAAAQVEAKHEILTQVSASDTSGASIPEEEKLRVLQSLRNE